VKMKIKQLGYIIARPTEGGGVQFLWRDTKPHDDAELVVKEHAIEFSVPAGYDYRQELVKMLCIERSEIERKFDNAMENVNKKIDTAMGVVREDEL